MLVKDYNFVRMLIDVSEGLYNLSGEDVDRC